MNCMKLPLSKIAEFMGATGEFPSEEVAQSYSIDSRTIGKGELFFAVKGERLDGHDYVGAALQKGAKHFVQKPVKPEVLYEILRYVLGDDPNAAGAPVALAGEHLS